MIFLSFAAVKADRLEDAKIQIKQQITRVYEENRYLLEHHVLSENEKKAYDRGKSGYERCGGGSSTQ